MFSGAVHFTAASSVGTKAHRRPGLHLRVPGLPRTGRQSSVACPAVLGRRKFEPTRGSSSTPHDGKHAAKGRLVDARRYTNGGPIVEDDLHRLTRRLHHRRADLEERGRVLAPNSSAKRAADSRLRSNASTRRSQTVGPYLFILREELGSSPLRHRRVLLNGYAIRSQARSETRTAKARTPAPRSGRSEPVAHKRDEPRLMIRRQLPFAEVEDELSTNFSG